MHVKLTIIDRYERLPGIRSAVLSERNVDISIYVFDGGGVSSSAELLDRLGE